VSARPAATDNGRTAAAGPALLKVGDLARRSGLTVRTLHHFDQIGLLTPSVRSEAGYRLYNRDDVARLHGIQALRRLGLPLKAIGSVLSGDAAELPLILTRQLQALDQEIVRAQTLRTQLDLLLHRVSAGESPEMDDWLRALELMATYARYFSPAEVQHIVGNWRRISDDWAALLGDLKQARAAGITPDSLALQPLAHRWMGLVHAWLGGDFELIERWGQMYLQEPGARDHNGPDLDTVQYIEPACQRRMAHWLKHFTLDELAAIRWVPAAEWRALRAEAQALFDQGLPVGAAAWQPLRVRWNELSTRVAGGDPAFQARMDAAYAVDPVLRAGLSVPAEVALCLMPHLVPHVAEADTAVEAARPARRSRPARTPRS
jgi:DNA-binding transcriptional MerR regulator